MKGVMTNMPVPFIGRLLNFLVFPLTKPYKGPDDRQGYEVARILLSPSDARARLTRGIYVSGEPDDATGRIDHALDHVLTTEKLERKLRSSMKAG